MSTPEEKFDWKDKRVIVTGGAGFLGSFVVEKLRARGCPNVFVPRSAEYDLRRRENIERLYTESKNHTSWFTWRRSWEGLARTRRILLRQRDYGHSAHGVRPPVRRRKVHLAGYNLFVSKIRAHSPRELIAREGFMPGKFGEPFESDGEYKKLTPSEEAAFLLDLQLPLVNV
ncbi:MAG TPA: hypothetical protein VGJ66_20685 [Pyrinomonadaceae bacterium]